ncbi:MAG: hypothetical protein V1929_07380 [bacterium]
MNRWVIGATLLFFLHGALIAAPAKSLVVTGSVSRAKSISSSRIPDKPAKDPRPVRQAPTPTSGSPPTHPVQTPSPIKQLQAPTGQPTPALVRPPKRDRDPIARPSRASEYEVVKIASFESMEERNDYDGGYFGVWSRDPDDEAQGCTMSFSEPGTRNTGYCLKLDYDVDSPRMACNGLWMLFVDLDVTPYSNLCFWMRSDKQTGATTKIVLELKNEDEGGRTIVDGITSEWQLMTVPLIEFGGISDWTMMTEFVIIFEDTVVTKETGTIYIDNIYFETARPKGNVDMEDPSLSPDETNHANTRANRFPPSRPSMSLPENRDLRRLDTSP